MTPERAVAGEGPTARARRARSTGRGTAQAGIGRHDEAPDAERGAGTVLVLGVVAAVLVLALGLAALAHAQAARGAAQTGADLAALAAATAARDGWDPCGRAREVAARNAASVTACGEQDGGVVRVDVASTTGVTVLGVALGRASAAARAGPATAR
ncbi:Rv3654c family TadE-like protein [Cellulosimicrobium cellulans]|uniref:Rv3654c family TadE-like protein n=1 Tax=Cellulosimicrobium cellulans TaxID=1710 RepID=UPI0024053762|nr:Rv3654c family TadE-like protein [Cellulosimicrobium cellulans]MDF9877854.1 secretion/DNA translocation related TadE-like protein [Cellulosimicrobium cellulans]